MAISASTIWECRATGLATNGGGFVAGGGRTDYTMQDSPQLALADIAIADGTTTTITSATGGFTSAMVGNIIYLTGGSGGTLATQRRQIAAYVDTNTVTLDQAPAPSAAMTSVTGNVGGAVSGPWDVASTGQTGGMVVGNTVYVRSGTYNRTAAWSISTLSGTSNTPVRFIGYDSDANRKLGVEIPYAARPLFVWGGAGSSGISWTGNGTVYLFQNFVFQNTATARGTCLTTNTSCQAMRFLFIRFTGWNIVYAGTTSSNNVIQATYVGCEIDDCKHVSYAYYNGSHSSNSSAFSFCYVHDNVGSGLANGASLSTSMSVGSCLIVRNGIYGIEYTNTNQPGLFNFSGNTIADNTVAQVRFTATSNPPTTQAFLATIASNILWGGQYCLRNTASANPYVDTLLQEGQQGSYVGGASVANFSNTTPPDWVVVLTQDPFVDSANGDYRLNNVVGGGREIRFNSAWPSYVPYIVTAKTGRTSGAMPPLPPTLAA